MESETDHFDSIDGTITRTPAASLASRRAKPRRRSSVSRQIAADEGIDCDFARVNGYLFLAEGDKSETLDQELAAAHRADLLEVSPRERASFTSVDSGPCLCIPKQRRDVARLSLCAARKIEATDDSGTRRLGEGLKGVAHLTVVPNQDPQRCADKLPLIEGESLLEGLLRHGIEIAHECGGTLACATCCVIVREGLETLTPAGEDEQDMLDRAGVSGPCARLSCQAVGGGSDLVVEIPRQEARQIVIPFPAIAAPVTLSERAAQHFAIQLERYPDAAVRLSVKPAGCAGFAYSVDHTDTVRDDDTVFESRGIRVVVDPGSLPHVQGTTLDLVQDGLARRLRFRNPNATETCGCGESFGT